MFIEIECWPALLPERAWSLLLGVVQSDGADGLAQGDGAGVPVGQGDGADGLVHQPRPPVPFPLSHDVPLSRVEVTVHTPSVLTPSPVTPVPHSGKL